MIEPADISVLVPLCGDLTLWEGRAQEYAVRSVRALNPPPAMGDIARADTVAQARNLLAAAATTEWICFLDADDELDAGYIGAMQAAILRRPEVDLFVPMVQYQTPGRDPIGPLRDLDDGRTLINGNFMVIGTVLRRDLFRDLGGFREWPMYEDWCLWLRAVIRGSTWVKVRDATYRATAWPESRNNRPAEEQQEWFTAIREEYLADWRRAGYAT